MNSAKTTKTGARKGPKHPIRTVKLGDARPPPLVMYDRHGNKLQRCGQCSRYKQCKSFSEPKERPICKACVRENHKAAQVAHR